jgi:O-antigen biosynthesis protein
MLCQPWAENGSLAVPQSRINGESIVNMLASGKWVSHGATISRRALLEHAGEVTDARRASGEQKNEADTLKEVPTACEAHADAVNKTPSRLTAPLRAISTSPWRFHRLLRRMLEVVSGVSALYLRRVFLRLLLRYRRYVPEKIRSFVSVHLPSVFKRLLVLERAKTVDGYEKWILENEKLCDNDCNLIRAHVASFKKNVKFSILVPVYNTPVQYLCDAIDSVVGQLYPNWELCIADDASTSADVRDTLHRYAQQDDRIKVCFRAANGGISAASNTALGMATGEWIVLMDHDDTLAPHALYLVAEAINRNPGLAIIYSDEDQLDAKGRSHTPYFKPDWDYDLFLSQNLISHLGAYRTGLVRQTGGFQEGLEGSQDWDLALRVLEAADHAGVHHVPFILYHWRQTRQTFSITAAARTRDAAHRAVSSHLKRTGQAAEVTPSGWSSYLRIKRILPARRPLVSIVIPTKDQSQLLQRCIDGLVSRTGYKPVEIVIVDNGSREPAARDLIAGFQLRPGFSVVEDEGDFNFSRLVNRGVAASSGEICLLLNNDVDVIHADWLDEMVVHALRPEVGAVGAKLYYADRTLQHGGVILGIGTGGIAGHQHRRAPREHNGYFGRLRSIHSLSCVTAACLATRRAVYDQVGGFDEEHLPVAFNDVDFCIRLRQAGYRVIWTPHAELYHHESCSRGVDTTPDNTSRFASDVGYMRAKWGKVLDNDPFYNPNLSLESDFFEFAATSRVCRPWMTAAGTKVA